VYVESANGRSLASSDAAQRVAVLEYKFAHYYDLTAGHTVEISGGIPLEIAGTGYEPEYFKVISDTGDMFGDTNLAVLFVPLDTVQQITGHLQQVNEVVIALDDKADPKAVQAEIQSRMAAAFPSSGFDLIRPQDDPAYSTLESEAAANQPVWDAIALLFLFGATMAAFNLAGRIVEAQRRQIGIGMSLGVPRRWIAFRPILVGVQIALLGTAFGLLLAQVFGYFFIKSMKESSPLPFWDIKFYFLGYVKAALFGILLPLVATLIPVWRAVRVPPIDAIKSGSLVAKNSNLMRILNKIPLPSNSLTCLPLRNVLRTPRRTILTALGVAVAIMLMTSLVGVMDSYIATMQQADHAYRYQGGERIVVNLDAFYSTEDNQFITMQNLTSTNGIPLFSNSSAGLAVGSTLIKGDESVDVTLELYDLNNPIWIPDLQSGTLPLDGPGIIISEKAAQDLGLRIGDNVVLRHPYREDTQTFRQTEDILPVVGIHTNPLRYHAYMSLSQASLMNLDHTANMLMVNPGEGTSADDVKAILMTQPGVVSVKPIAEFSEAVDNLLKASTGILGVVQIAVVALAVLITFNSTSMNVDERVREIATMFSFGLPIRAVIWMQVIENMVIGVMGTLLGIGLGWLSLTQFLIPRVQDVAADIGFTATFSLSTLLMAIMLGVIVVGVTPLLNIRRMVNMNLPSTLRVME
jgi:putative ABC transport system permease protein